jgi:hypothetical protein
MDLKQLEIFDIFVFSLRLPTPLRAGALSVVRLAVVVNRLARAFLRVRRSIPVVVITPIFHTYI